MTPTTDQVTALLQRQHDAIAHSTRMGMKRNLINKDRDWNSYPLGTKAHSFNGGYWLRVSGGWQWQGKYSTFPAPSADAINPCIELPNAGEQ